MQARATRKKETTHERIVETAARAIRRHGYDGISVAGIMQQAGLTHGGFYAHFASREAMLAEAANQAGNEIVDMLSHIAASAPPGKSLDALLRTYLSRRHVRNPEVGCPIAALGSEIPRQAPAVRHAVTRRIEEMVAVVSRQLSDTGRSSAQQQALVAVSTMIGAVILARAVDTNELSDSVLKAVLAHLTPTAGALPTARGAKE